MTNSTHGGRREGAGRKPKSPDERLDQAFTVRVTTDEKRLLDDVGARAWARDVLVRAAKRQTPMDVRVSIGGVEATITVHDVNEVAALLQSLGQRLDKPQLTPPLQ